MRGTTTGSIRHRSTWEYRLDLGSQPAQRCTSCDARYWVGRTKHEVCPVCGGDLKDRNERRVRTETGFATKAAAQAELTKALASMAMGGYVEQSKLTVAQYLRSEWLPAIAGTIRPSTLASYTSHVETHIIPAMGTGPLQRLSAGRINALYSSLQVARPAGPGLSATTVRRVHATLHRALRDAVRWGHVPRNVSDQADPPRVTRGGDHLHVWTVDELQTFLAAVHDDRQYPLWLTLLSTGMRRGEALALRWTDLDLDVGMVATQRARVTVGYAVVENEPKTRRGRRAVDLDPGTITVLKAWRKAQLEERVQWGKLWTDTKLVFTREDGVGWHPNRITKLFDETIVNIQKAERVEAEKRGDEDPKILPRIRLHDLRHTHATVALASGEHPKVVSERLGHATVGMTLDVYSHVVPGLQKEAAARIGLLIFGA